MENRCLRDEQRGTRLAEGLTGGPKDLATVRARLAGLQTGSRRTRERDVITGDAMDVGYGMAGLGAARCATRWMVEPGGSVGHVAEGGKCAARWGPAAGLRRSPSGDARRPPASGGGAIRRRRWRTQQRSMTPRRARTWAAERAMHVSSSCHRTGGTSLPRLTFSGKKHASSSRTELICSPGGPFLLRGPGVVAGAAARPSLAATLAASGISAERALAST